jgi:hypothetical protein
MAPLLVSGKLVINEAAANKRRKRDTQMFSNSNLNNRIKNISLGVAAAAITGAMR